MTQDKLGIFEKCLTFVVGSIVVTAPFAAILGSEDSVRRDPCTGEYICTDAKSIIDLHPGRYIGCWLVKPRFNQSSFYIPPEWCKR